MQTELRYMSREEAVKLLRITTSSLRLDFDIRQQKMKLDRKIRSYIQSHQYVAQTSKKTLIIRDMMKALTLHQTPC